MFRKPSPSLSLIPLCLLLPRLAFAQSPDEPSEGPTLDETSAEENEAPKEIAPLLEEELSEPVEEPEVTQDEDSASDDKEPRAVVVEEEEPTDDQQLGKEPTGAEEREETEVPDEEVAPPPDPSLLPFKVGTHTFSRFETRENYDELGVSRARFQEGDQTVYRARLTFQTNSVQLIDDITGHVYVAPQASGVWGTHGIGGTIGEASLGIYEGYFTFQGKVLEGKAGRFAMNYGNAAVIGNLDWHQSGRAFDGAHFRVKAGKTSIDLFATQQSEGWPIVGDINDDFLDGDAYYWGLYSQIGAAIAEGLELDLYALGKSTAATDATDDMGNLIHKDGATFMTLGMRAQQKVAVFDYNIEGGFQIGKQVGLPRKTSTRRLTRSTAR